MWLDEDDVAFMKTRFGEREGERVLALVQENLGDLLALWASLRDDVRRERFDRNRLVD